MNSADTLQTRRGGWKQVALAAAVVLGLISPTAVRAELDVSSVSGSATAVVSGSGNGLRLRYEPDHDSPVLQVLPDGTEVELLLDEYNTYVDDDGTTRWWPVSVDGQGGWVSGFYLTLGESSTSSSSSSSSNSGSTFSPGGSTTAIVDGNGSVNLRWEPSTSATIVTSVSDGATVNLLLDEFDSMWAEGYEWWPVEISGHRGWIAGDFLSNGGSTTTETSSGTFPAGSYVATYTGDGDGVRLRSAAGSGSTVLMVLGEGTVLQVMEGPVSWENSANGWFKVTNGETTGFIDGDLLVAADQLPAPEDEETSAPAAFTAGNYAAVDTESDSGARLRTEATTSSTKILVVPELGIVQIVSGPASWENSANGWYEVRYGETVGFIDGDLLVASSAPETEAPTSSTSGFGAGVSVVTNSFTGVGINVRIAPGTYSDRVGYFADFTSLTVVEGPSMDTSSAHWYKVTNGDTEGWVSAEFLQLPDVAAAAQEESANAETSSPLFITPIDGGYIVSQEYGCSYLGYYVYNAAWGCPLHDGIDLAITSGSTLRASASGTVTFAGWCDCGLGYYVEIDHGNGFSTIYGHMLQQPSVGTGDFVNQGESIGLVGSTGLSTGPHVHFMVRENGTAVDPRLYIDF